MRSQKTFQIKLKDVKKKWQIVDASGIVLGRLATRIARVLQGKHMPYFSPNVDCGDFVIVINASKIKLTGNKLEVKYKFHHSGYLGGEKYDTYKRLMVTHPDRIVYLAVQNMLPKNRLQAKYLKHLKIYPGAEHPHGAQEPVAMSMK